MTSGKDFRIEIDPIEYEKLQKYMEEREEKLKMNIRSLFIRK
jgi:hypothetical protein